MNSRFRIVATITLLGTAAGMTDAHADESFSLAPGNGLATSIGAGPYGPWVIGYPANGDTSIFHFNGVGWPQMRGAAAQIAVSATGAPWVVTAAGQIYSWSNNSNANNWMLQPGCARSIGVGPDNDAWVVGCGTAADEPIYQFNGSTWVQAPGMANKIAVSPEGIPWVITSAGNIYQWRNRNWQPEPGCAQSIGVGPNNDAWVIGCGSGDTAAFQFNGSTWVQQPGAGVQVSVSPTGVPWILTADGHIYEGSSGVAPADPLPIPPVAQEENNWCWATTGQMIMSYYGTQISQCQQASDMVARQNPPAQDCCASANKADAACNHTSGIHLDWYGFTATGMSGALPWDSLQAELTSRPVAFAWTSVGGGSAHWMVAVGTKVVSGQTFVTINNPAGGSQTDITYADYVGAPTYTTGANYYNIFPSVY
jgi:hypothetical protein